MRSPRFLQTLRKRKPFLLRRVAGESMEPRFKPNHLVIATGWFRARALRQGDVVIVRHEGMEKIKRIQRLKDKRVYLAGDNPGRSTDSRSFGWLPRRSLRAKVLWPLGRSLSRREIIALLARAIGVLGTVTGAVYFVLHPTWPTSDKIVLYLTFVFMSLGQAWTFLKRFVPFVAILVTYESFRGLAPILNTHVHYTFMANFDKFLTGGTLPTVTLQHWLWHGHVSWYDFVFYGAYMMHFVWPLVLAVCIWKKREHAYWRVVGTYAAVSYLGFLTYILYPAAPPWMSSQMGIIPQVTHVSGPVFSAMGIQSFPSLYDHVSPNAVAAVPSLHAAYATVFAYFVWRYFGKKWGMLAALHPLLIYFGTIYMAEHYLFDELLGIVYGLGSIALVNLWIKYAWPVVKRRLRHVLRRPAADMPAADAQPE